jgi:transposase
MTRKRHSEAFKREALALAERIGVNDAARELGLHSSQLYGWRSKAQVEKTRGQIDQEQARELARLKRELADKDEV